MEAFLEDHRHCKILCISEHWKTYEQLTNFGIKGFYLASSICREEKQHGGSAIYIRQEIQSKERQKTKNFSIINIIECSAAECRIGTDKLIILSIYRPTNNDNVSLDAFFRQLEKILADLISEKAIIVVAGDFNIEMLKVNKVGDILISLFNSYNIFPTIKDNTRIQNNSRTCIDNIFTNFYGEWVGVVLDSMISDHTAQKLSIYIEGQLNYYYSRCFSENNIQKFKLYLTAVSWQTIFEIDEKDVNLQWSRFIEIFHKLFEDSFPIKKLMSNSRTKMKEKDDVDVIECKRQLDVLYTVSRVDNRYRGVYNLIRKQYNKLLTSKKAGKFEKKLMSSDNKSKTVWSIVREIKGTCTRNKNLQMEGNIKDIAEGFNNYIVNCVTELTSGIKNTTYNCNFTDNRNTIFIKPVTKSEICNIVNQFKNKMSSGEDNVPLKIIKLSIQNILDPVCYIINNSLQFGIFPDELKVALIKPIHKKGSRSEFGNYRPISLLPSFSKIFESAMASRLTDFFITNKLLHENQHGFLKGKSTNTAIYEFTNKILKP